MTGSNKKLHYSEIYLIRVNKKTKQKLKKIGSKTVREYLENLKIK